MAMGTPGPELRYRRHEFRSMGTTMALVGPVEEDLHGAGSDAWESAVAGVESAFAEVDARFSRFRPDSELSRVNANAGRWTDVTEPFAELLWMSLMGAARTDGLFDPTVLPALVAAGYDRDWDELRADGAPNPEVPSVRPAWSRVRLRGMRVRLPAGAALDFGGIAKGWAVDIAATATAPLPWALVSAGGDLRIVGSPPLGALDVAVEDPWQDGVEAARLSLEGGALATSSVTCRSWGPGLHHVIDPRTARPAVSQVVQATVWAETCADAEVLSTWALLTGRTALDRVPGVLIMDDGNIVTNLGADDRLPVLEGVTS
jgi:thiamine biosynthesis lipoprotein